MKTSLLSILMIVALSFQGIAQDSTVVNHTVAFTNTEVLLVFMPEYKAVEQQLQSYQMQLGKQLNAKLKNLQTIALQITQGKQNNTLSDEEYNALVKRYGDLETEITKLKAENDQKVSKKQMELIRPLGEKLQVAINEVAQSKGFDYVLNNTAGNGIGTIVYGMDGVDITKDIALKLGIPWD